MKNFHTKPISDINNLKQNPKIMTFGTYDLLHNGHINLFNNILQLTKEENMFIGVSSDAWNVKKNKKSFESQETRLNNIKNKYKNATIFYEEHNVAEETWPELFDKYDIDYILMGGDHFETLKYINNLITPKGRKMKIIFFERTKGISSTILRNKI